MSSSCAKDVAPDLKLEAEVVSELCKTIDSPRSLAVALMVEYGEFEQLLELETDANHYENPSNFADDYLVTSILSKSPNLPLGIDRAAQARASFYEAELCCYYANQRIAERPFERERELITWISRVLGPCDSFALSEIDRRMRHGPGATASLRGSGIVTSDKYDEDLSLTVDLLPYYKGILGSRWHHASSGHAQVVAGNKFTTVPKNAKTDRGICAEPTLNMYLQLGIGAYLRTRLGKFGVDLNDQSRNQKLAKRAWRDGLVTIDLSAASDSLARNVVLRFFPEDWAELLILARSHRCLIDGEWIELEKFSSMGNGFTFELESLLFYSVIRCFVPKERMRDVGVYGDDLICPHEYADAVIAALKFLGFKVNAKKTFLAGVFFESCGTDWFKGQNVRPFYLKGSGGNIPYSLQVANKLRLYAWERCNRLGCDPRFRPLWQKLTKQTPKFWRELKVPAYFGDSGLICSFLESKAKRARDQVEGFIAKSACFKPIRRDKRRISVLLARLPRGKPTPQFEDPSGDGINRYNEVFDALWKTRVRLSSASHLSSEILRDVELTDALPTYGREARRGFLGRVYSKKSIIKQWTDGLDWL